MKKVVPGFLKFMVADNISNYEIEFGRIMNPEWKAMLIALGLFLDFRYFNERSDKNDHSEDGVAGGVLAAGLAGGLVGGLEGLAGGDGGGFGEFGGFGGDGDE